jgi:hypothetical protein
MAIAATATRIELLEYFTFAFPPTLPFYLPGAADAIMSRQDFAAAAL